MAATARRKSSSTTTSPDRETLGSFVRSRRTANRLTLKQLAELAGVGLRAVWELEHDKPTLRLDTANAVLRIFGKQLGVVDLARERK